jgi:HD-like signal output (HDOD) protein
MLKILFVQPNLQNSQALEAALIPQRGEWEMCFVSDAEAALHHLEMVPQDVIVADLASESDKSLLARVRESFPEVVRIGLVHQTHSRLRHLSIVHQFLLRPFDVRELEVAVERSCKLRDLLQGELICSTLGKLEELPAAPTVYLRLLEKLNQEPEVSVDEVAEIVEADPAISAKLLQLVNSAIFRTSCEIATVRLAASYLGLNAVKDLVLSTEVFRAFENSKPIPGFSVEELQIHGRLTAKIAGRMHLPASTRDAAIVASLLHDIGKLVLAWKMPDRFARLLARAREQNQPLYQVEEELWGITHAEIGAYLLGLWGLPIGVTEAIAFHHSPSRVPHCRFDAIAAVYMANLLAHDHDGSVQGGHSLRDLSLLQNLGVADQLPSWEEIAEEMASSRDELPFGSLK